MAAFSRRFTMASKKRHSKVRFKILCLAFFARVLIRSTLLLQGSLGNLGDFEQMLSDCVELSELATIMATEMVADATSKEARR